MKIIILALLILIPSIAVAEIDVAVIPSEERTSISSFPEDHLDLILRENGQQIDTYYFYSSYGEADAEVIKDAKEINYILLKHGKGRGTHVRCEYITIFKVFKKLNKLVTFPLNGPAGFTSGWEYSYRVIKPKEGGLKFILTLEVTGENPEVYPEDKARIIEVK